MRVPPALAAEWAHEPGWLASLPELVAACGERWELQLEEAIDTPHSLVVPAGEVVLKVNAPSHVEAEHEPDALARWDGAGAVRLVARDDSLGAFLSERCRPGAPLRDAAADEHSVVAGLLERLSMPLDDATPFRRLADEAAHWADDLPRWYELGGRPFAASVLDEAVETCRSADPDACRLVNQDLHAGNVLSAAREPWLLVDPKPLVGEPELDGVGLLRNAAVGTDARATVRRWLDTLAELGLDRERLRAWAVAHALAWGWDDARGWSERAVAAATTIHEA